MTRNTFSAYLRQLNQMEREWGGGGVGGGGECLVLVSQTTQKQSQYYRSIASPK